MPHSSKAPLALLGGTFDPPHIGHLFLAECARHQFNASRVLFLPAGDPYKKSGSLSRGGSGSPVPRASFPVPPSAAADRLAMAQLAITGNPHFILDDRETRRSGPTFTVDTLEELHAEGQTNLVLILGEDAVNDLPTWKDPARIQELATIAVAPKPWQSQPHSPPLPPGRERQNPYPGEEGRASFLRIAMPPLAISSTLIRQRVAAGEPIRYLVPAAVEAYIGERRLYWDSALSTQH